MVEEQIAIAQHYINCRKDVEVKIAIRNQRDLLLLQKAYIDAINWFEQNNIKITLNN